MKMFRGRAVRLAAVGAVAAMGLTFAPAPANAASGFPGCGLTWQRAATSGYVTLSLSCSTGGSPGERIWKIELWGDDTWNDDRLHTYYVNCDLPQPATMTLHENWLNEDTPDSDEVYAKAYFRDDRGNTWVKSSVVITGRWGNRTVVERPSSTLC
jgi:hypothetical protein